MTSKLKKTFYFLIAPVHLSSHLQVFAGVYPIDSGDYVPLRAALDRLTLNDSSVTVYPDASVALGQGWRLGFLGLLHMDVFRQRLEEVSYCSSTCGRKQTLFHHK